ncbi:MAG: transporter substrate-binding protein [Ramlibacter sp.]|nr:transporter substrate-binding protein [Ramlibacter sp.]
MKTLHLISGGAAQGLVRQLQERFAASQGVAIEGTFGAVGLMRDKVLAGDPCDVLILTGEQISDMAPRGQIVARSARALGRVKTGVAVKAGVPLPAVDTPKALEALLQRAQGIYFPDPLKATAGIHFMRVLRMLGLDEKLADNLRPFPNGATAMREMAAATGEGLVGCTQVTEILYTPGVQLAGPLPAKFELATMYTAAVSTRSTQPEAAAALVELLAGDEARAVRQAGGFEAE